MGKGSVPGTVEKFHNLTRISARENVIEACRRESFKAYSIATYSVLLKIETTIFTGENTQNGWGNTSQGSPQYPTYRKKRAKCSMNKWK